MNAPRYKKNSLSKYEILPAATTLLEFLNTADTTVTTVTTCLNLVYNSLLFFLAKDVPNRRHYDNDNNH